MGTLEIVGATALVALLGAYIVGVLTFWYGTFLPHANQPWWVRWLLPLVWPAVLVVTWAHNKRRRCGERI